jgi:hypothetical protein
MRFQRLIIIWSLLCILISGLQLYGITSLQFIGSGIETKGYSSFPVFFQDLNSISGITTSQARPNGITHANNLTSMFLLFFYIITITFIINNKSGYLTLAVVSFASVINGGKIIVIIFLISFFYLFTIKLLMKTLIIRIILITFLPYLCFYFLFPGVFIYNFSFDVFLGNIFGRLIDIGVTFNNKFITDISITAIKIIPSETFVNNHSTDHIISATSVNKNAYSNMTLIGNYIFIYLLFILFSIIFFLKYLRDNHLCLLILLSSTAYIFASPLITTTWYVFFLSSPAFVILDFIKRKFLSSQI